MVEDAETLIYLVPPSRYISPTSLSLLLSLSHSMEGRIKSTSIVSAAGRSTAVGYMCCCKCACVHRNCCAVYRGLILVNNSVYCMYGNSSHFCCRQTSRYFLGTETQLQLKRKRNQMVTVWSGNFFSPPPPMWVDCRKFGTELCLIDFQICFAVALQCPGFEKQWGVGSFKWRGNGKGR